MFFKTPPGIVLCASRLLATKAVQNQVSELMEAVDAAGAWHGPGHFGQLHLDHRGQFCDLKSKAIVFCGTVPGSCRIAP